MRGILSAGVLTAGLVLAGAAQEPPELAKAREEFEHVRGLVEAGALPRRALVEAETALAEANDEAILERTLYGNVTVEQLTDEQNREMLAAAGRLVVRQEKELAKMRLLVEEGAMARTVLAPYEEELQRRHQILELARQRAKLFEELAAIVAAEREWAEAMKRHPEAASRIAERYDGSGVFLPSQLEVISLAFERQFHYPLPISARGETALHRSFGFDHRGRVDVALHPDTQEGRWLRRLLEQMHIPYFAFRGAVPRKSTGAHIHIGPPSGRLRRAD